MRIPQTPADMFKHHTLLGPDILQLKPVIK